MQRITSAALSGLLVWALWQGIQVYRLRETTLDFGEETAIIEKDREAALATLRRELSEQLEWGSGLELAGPGGEEEAFQPLDIPLDEALQRFTYEESRKSGIDPLILFLIMEQESRFQTDAIGYNKNGTTDIGLCQINSVNWAWLAEEGIDVHTPEGNIRAAIRILDMHLEECSMEQALAAYAVGRTGMERGGGRWYAELILSQRDQYAA